MKPFFTHLRIYIVRGLLAIIPIWLSYTVLKFLYNFIIKKTAGNINNIVKEFLGFSIPLLDLFLVLLLLYCIGLIASNVVGKQLFGFIEGLTKRIPLIRTTYQIGKQLSDTFSLPEKQLFKRVVLVNFFAEGAKVIGFVTGTMKEDGKETLLAIFVPTVPNPTSGFLVILKESQVTESSWSVEEAMRMVISGGIISPQSMLRKNKE